MAIDSSRPPELHKDCLLTILRHCDEPTRDSSMLVSHEMKSLTDVARRLDYTEAARRPGRWTKEGFPTAIELSDRGCRKPNWKHIAKTMQTPDNHLVGRATQGPLTCFYERAIGLLDAQKLGLAFTLNSDTGRYVGGGANMTPEGFGIWELASGSRYEGSFRNGYLDGHVVKTNPDGTIYEGGYKAGKREGYGVEIQPDVSRYEGIWKDGKREGQGVETYPNGWRYEGSWKADRWDGYGVTTHPDGSHYEGGWKDGKLHEGIRKAGEKVAQNTSLTSRLLVGIKAKVKRVLP